ncbi:hypothetical protein [Microbacterium sp. GXF6406]
MSTTISSPTAVSDSPADRFMRRLLRITTIQKSVKTEREAHRGFRTSMIVSGVRCLITYLLVPILVPIIGFAGIVAAPIGIALCLIAAVNGVVSVRRFWLSDHRARWMYTWFIAFVFVVLAIAMVADIARIVGA